MNAIALALPTPLPAAGQPATPAPDASGPVSAAAPGLMPSADPVVAPAAGLALLATTCIDQTAELLRLACRRGQLEDAAAAARVALPLARPHSPHAAMLQALAQAQPALMVAPEERRLYLLRRADGSARGVLRLRDNGRVGLAAPAGAGRWTLRDGNLELCDSAGHTSARFALCGDRDGLRLYLGETLADSTGGAQPCVLEELRCTYARLSLLDPELVDPFCGLYDAEAMVPAELPARAALLLAAPHSRADRLAQALNRSSGLHFDGELLHPQGLSLNEALLSPGAAHTLLSLRAKDAPWFARMMLSRSHDALGRHLNSMAVRGFCMAPSHSSQALDWAMAEAELRIVHVVRSNLLAEFADTLASQPGSGLGLLHFEPERFVRFVEMKLRYLGHLRQRLRQRNADTVEVDGSRLNQATMAELLGFLTDNPDTAGIACEPVPSSGQRVVERFANRDAVLPCLLGLNRPGWAEVEGELLDPE